MLIIIAISTFVCISLGMLGIYWLLYKPQSAATERLRRLGGKEGGMLRHVQSVVIPDDSPAAEIAQRLAKPLNKLLPPSATEAKKLQKQLMHAGFRSPEAPIIYRAIQLARWLASADGGGRLRRDWHGRSAVRWSTSSSRSSRVLSCRVFSWKNHQEPPARAALGTG